MFVAGFLDICLYLWNIHGHVSNADFHKVMKSPTQSRKGAEVLSNLPCVSALSALCVSPAEAEMPQVFHRSRTRSLG